MSSTMSIVPAAPLEERVRIIGSEGLDWPFEIQGQAQARIVARSPGNFSRTINVDPFPCYTHNINLVRDWAAKVEELFPIQHFPNYFVLEYEETSRTNGHAGRHWIYQKTGPDDREPYIVLGGKRIPPHPGMTRYLVAHEFGHCVQWHIEKVRKIDSNQTVTDFDREYCALRNIPVDELSSYGGRKWHANVGELIANDFRICVTRTEVEFWPHDGFDHPDSLPQVHEFWEKAVGEWAAWPVTDTVEEPS